MVVDAINRYGWTSSIGSGGRHHSVRPTIGVGRRISHYVDELTLYFTSVSITLFGTGRCLRTARPRHAGSRDHSLFQLRLEVYHARHMLQFLTSWQVLMVLAAHGVSFGN